MITFLSPSRHLNTEKCFPISPALPCPGCMAFTVRLSFYNKCHIRYISVSWMPRSLSGKVNSDFTGRRNQTSFSLDSAQVKIPKLCSSKTPKMCKVFSRLPEAELILCCSETIRLENKFFIWMMDCAKIVWDFVRSTKNFSNPIWYSSRLPRIDYGAPMCRHF